mmetsp:Transcript_55598/g.130971  ORF Transcript_55598/g.130971 Transcript_55598/m.130971 type:complete len:512 (-) Transcript_55598:73-1608(-)
MVTECNNDSSRRRALWFRPKLRWNNSKKGLAPNNSEHQSANARPPTPPSLPFGMVKSLFSKVTAGLKTRRLSLPDAVMENGKKRWKLKTAYPLISDKLYFCCIPKSRAKAKIQPPESGFICVDSKFPGQYFPFGRDFGPTCIAVVVRFCDFLKTKLQGEKKVIFCMAEEARIRTNAAFLLASYLVLVEGMTPEDAMEGFQGFNVDPFMDFCDVMGSTEVDHQLSLESSLRGLFKAFQTGLFSLDTFDLSRYEHYDKPESGDVHWPCNKLLAFKGPISDPDMEEKDSTFQRPEFYVDVFKRHGVTAVVRLNEAERYPSSSFTDNSINHYELFFEDCSAPSAELVQDFLDICEREEGSVAVHCRAGLGRTGTLVAAWLMHKHGFSALEAVGWVRIVRPGSIVGRQQAFLLSMEQSMENLAALDCLDLEVEMPGHEDGIDAGVAVTRAAASLAQPVSAPATVMRDTLLRAEERSGNDEHGEEEDGGVFFVEIEEHCAQSELKQEHSFQESFLIA